MSFHAFESKYYSLSHPHFLKAKHSQNLHLLPVGPDHFFLLFSEPVPVSMVCRIGHKEVSGPMQNKMEQLLTGILIWKPFVGSGFKKNELSFL